MLPPIRRGGQGTLISTDAAIDDATSHAGAQRRNGVLGRSCRSRVAEPMRAGSSSADTEAFRAKTMIRATRIRAWFAFLGRSPMAIIGSLAITVSACSASGPLFKRHSDPGPEGGLIYLYRPDRFVHKAGAPEILIDSKKVVTLRNNGYTAVYVTPGSHVIVAKRHVWSWDIQDMVVQFKVLPGTTYFVRLLLDTDLFVPGPVTVIKYRVKLGLVEPTEALREIAECRFIEPET